MLQIGPRSTAVPAERWQFIGWRHLIQIVMASTPGSGSPHPSSELLARYLEQRGELSKPWMLQLLRLTKIKEAKHTMAPEDFLAKVQEAHADLMRLGEFWQGREAEVFSGRYQPPTNLEPLPGSPQDR
jgi:hypothetical protein